MRIERDVRAGGRTRFRVGIAAVALGVGLCASAVGTARASTATTTTYYFHGAGTPNDDVNRANSSPSATFDTTAPTGTTDSSQTGSVDANPELAENPLSVYWVSSTFRGHLEGAMQFAWYWSTANPETTVTGETATVTVYGDGAKIGQGDVSLTIGTSPTLNKVGVSNVLGNVAHSLVIQVTVDHVDSGNAVTAHYNSTAAPSSFTAAVSALPVPTPTPTPAPCTGPLCFSPPVVLPDSDQTGSTSDTCYSACGEPSLVKSPVDGTLYVSTPRTILVCCNSQASPVWKSSDSGATWSKPIFPSAPESATTGGDTELAVDKRGTVYEGELWLGSDSIYSSSDKGATWNWSPASHDLLADREWFVYAPGEDALYGYYDGIKGLMVVKAPLSTPLGSTTTEFFPQEQVAVPEWIDCPGVLAGPCVEKPGPVPDSVGGKPVLAGDIAPGRPSVSPVDGTLYFPFPYQVAGQGVGIATTTDGINFTYSYVKGAGHGVFGDTHNDFPVTAVDAAGRLYVAWIENKGDGFNVYVASSGDKGATWTAPLEVSKGISATAVFPNIVAGAAGQAAVSWYGTNVKGDPNNGNDPAKDPASVKNASWNVYATAITSAASASPTLTNGIVQSSFHTGVICTMGTGCTGNGRMLLDFFDMQLDKNGALGVVYPRDAGGAGKTEIAYSHQVTGCTLTAACQPAATVPESPSVAAVTLTGGSALAITLLVTRRRRRRSAA